MKIFTRYIAVRFLGPFLFGLGIFALLVFMGDLFDKLQRLVNSPAKAWVICEYLLLEMPYWAIRVVPMATLLATLFSVTGFVQSGEFVAVQASGFPAGKLFRPLLVVSLGIALGSFIAQETLLPACYKRAQFLWREKIHPEWEWDKYMDVVLAAGPERFVTANEFLVGKGLMVRPVMDVYGPHGLVQQVDARGARWDPGRGLWVFEDGVQRAFGPDGRMSEERNFARQDTGLVLPPKSLVPRPRNPEEMSLAEIWRYIRHFRWTGESPYPLRVALQAKIAYPFTNLILCAIGIPIALRLGKASRGLSFALALLVSFLYLWTIEAAKAMGNAGILSAFIAAWTPNALFGGLASWVYRKTEV